jgi:putative flippase GtrA
MKRLLARAGFQSFRTGFALFVPLGSAPRAFRTLLEVATARWPILDQCTQAVKQFARFVAVGIANTVFGYALIFGFMFIAGWSPEVSNIAGYSIGLITSYVMNRTITFRSTNERKSEFVRFLAVFAISFGANFVALWIMLHLLGVQDWLAQILAGLVYVATSYLLNRAFVFGGLVRRQSRAQSRIQRS